MREQFPEETEETQKEDDSNDAKEALKIRQSDPQEESLNDWYTYIKRWHWCG